MVKAGVRIAPALLFKMSIYSMSSIILKTLYYYHQGHHPEDQNIQHFVEYVA